jgi:hypothetical protein
MAIASGFTPSKHNSMRFLLRRLPGILALARP